MRWLFSSEYDGVSLFYEYTSWSVPFVNLMMPVTLKKVSTLLHNKG